MGRESDAKILERLDEWQKDALPGAIELYARLVRVQLEAKATIPLPEPSAPAEEISERLRYGNPLLGFDELGLDWPKVENLFNEALSIIAEYAVEGVPQSDVALEQVARDWYEDRLACGQDDEEPLVIALHSALKPFLAAWAEALSPHIDQSLWRRGYCPVCAGTPHFAVLRGEEGARWLLCPRCDAEWRFQRLECPFCGNRDQGTLAYFPDAAGLYRLYVCDQCKGYIKAIDLRQSSSEVLLTLEWIATLDMDRQAVETGYKAGRLVIKRNGDRGH